MADKDEPWKGDNVSIDFIVPDSEQDKKKLRARVEQNASGTIQPFDVTTYQYDSTLIDPTDITTIFKAIIVFLNGGGYTDPFIGTPKQAKTLPRHSNIKPHRGSTSSTPLTCSRNISIDDNYLNEMTIYCLGDIIPLNENKQYNKKSNMKRTIKLRESELKQMIAESVENILMEDEIEEVTVDPRWWRKDGELPDMKGGTYRKPKQIKVSEAQLRQIVKESVEQVLSEAYSDAQYAHLAGQANGALSSFGGKLKGMFNPKWKSRKERQMRQFANQATHDNPGYERSSTKGGDNNDGGNTYEMPEHNYTWSNGGQADYIANSFNPQNQESPFEMKRTQRYVTVDDPSNIFSKRSSRAMANDGDVYSRGETRDMSKKYADNNEWDKVDAIDKLRDSNSRLNRAFNKGKEARNGGTYGGYNGTPTYKNGTGTQSGAFKRLK